MPGREHPVKDRHGDGPGDGRHTGLHPAWVAFIRHCQELDYGEIGQLKIQGGLPVMAEETVKKTKFI